LFIVCGDKQSFKKYNVHVFVVAISAITIMICENDVKKNVAKLKVLLFIIFFIYLLLFFIYY
jgi:hypothetical protein